MSDKYESLKDKLFKLKALAERGVGGEADNFMFAYVQKHGLVCHTEHDADKELSKEDLERLMKAVTLMRGMSDRTYIKSIENK